MSEESTKSAEETLTDSAAETPKVRRFSRKRKVIQIEIENEDGGIEDAKLTEMTGGQREQWQQDALSKGVKTDKDGKPTGLKDNRGLAASLINRCITDKAGKPIPVEQIQSWPSEMQTEIANICSDMNGLSPKGAEQAKKD